MHLGFGFIRLRVVEGVSGLWTSIETGESLSVSTVATAMK